MKIALQLWKRYRNLTRCMEILGVNYHAAKRILRSAEDDIFGKYPVRHVGRPAELRTALSESELRKAKKLYGKIPLPRIADLLGIWRTRLEYFLWKAGVYKPGTRTLPMKGDAPEMWPKSWQREYVMTEMKKKNQQFEQVVDHIFPKEETHTSGEEDEILDLLREYGIE